MSESKELPKGWAEATVGDIASSIQYGHTASATDTRTAPRFLRITDIQDGQVDWGTVPSCDISEEDIPKYALQADDIVFARTGATTGKSFLIKECPQAVFASYLIRLRMNKGIHASFVQCFFNTNDYWRQIEGGKRGIGQPNVNASVLAEVSLSVAPLPEQHRIVEKIEELFSDLDAGVSALQRAKANLKRYRASVLKSAVEGRLTEEWRKEHPQAEDAVGHIERTPPPPLPNRWSTRSKDTIYGHGALSVGNTGTRLPASWTWTPLVRIARMETGHTPSRKHPEWWGGEIPWIGITDARNHHGGIINATGENTNDDGLANSASRLLPKGTVCVSRTASVGYVVVMGCDMATSQDFVNWVPTDCVSSDWLRVVFMTDRNVLVRFGKGTVHKTIYFPEWLSTHIALPPLAEQEQIVLLVEERLSQIDSAVKTIDAELIRAKRLRQSILKQAFEGKLVPQDPKDEPASVLLERIKASQAEQPKKKAKKARARAK